MKSGTFLLICVALVAFSSSCASIHKGAEPQKGAEPAGPGVTSIEDIIRLAQEQVAHGEYKKALAIYSTAYDKYHHPRLQYRYAGAGEHIRTAADAAYQRKAFADAGSLYLVLFESCITTRNFAGSLSFNDGYLGGQIKACSKALTEIGLVKYREEKLDEAISIWQKVLAFDRDNKGVMKAIHTATRQLQKLKNFK